MTYFPFGHIIKPLPTYDHSHQAWNGLGGVRMGRLGCSCIEIMAARLPKTSRVVSVCVCVSETRRWPFIPEETESGLLATDQLSLSG